MKRGKADDLRIAHLSLHARPTAGAALALPESHAADLGEARHPSGRVLDDAEKPHERRPLGAQPRSHGNEHGRDIVWGVLVALLPAVSAIVLTWWLGAYALVFGGALIGLAIRLRRRRSGSGSIARARA
jgi:hypothetical protein